MRAVSLHPDVVVVTSAVLHVNCVIVRGAGGGEREGLDGEGQAGEGAREETEPFGETFVIDSPVLPDELDALMRLLDQARFSSPSGLLVTHGDWDHLLGALAFPGVALGCAESTASRLQAAPGEAQRELRAFDERLMIERPRPLALGAVQPLPVPGRCDIGDRTLELHAADGHTCDGMAVLIPWARVLVVGDYLSEVEIPTLDHGGDLRAYLATLERLRELLAVAEHVVPGHGPVLDPVRALAVLDEDRDYLQALSEQGVEAELPASRRGAAQRQLHGESVARLSIVED
jgi:glyoxylase-like metal-dependent hydrolase (beta-lactamase superfamily II)